MFPADIEPLAKTITDRASDAGIMLATAESCTAGLLVAALTTVSGSAKAVDRGFVTYSNAAKNQMLGVDAKLIDLHGAVSRAVAEAMAKGALETSGAGLAASVTGIAGPTGGTAEKPVGLVYIGVAELDGRTQVTEQRFGNIGRSQVRQATLEAALKALLAEIH